MRNRATPDLLPLYETLKSLRLVQTNPVESPINGPRHPVSRVLRIETGLRANRKSIVSFYLLWHESADRNQVARPWVAVVLAIQQHTSFGVESDHVDLAGVAVVKQYLVLST